MKVVRTYSKEADKIKSDLLAGLKKHLRITTNDFDLELAVLLDAALETAEKETGCVFLPSEFVITNKTTINTEGYYPVFEATTVKINNESVGIDVAQISGGKILIEAEEESDIELTFDAGYTTLPAPVMIAIFLIAGAWWQKPIDSVEVMQKASTNLLKNYRRWLR